MAPQSQNFNATLASIKKDFPEFKLVSKTDSGFMKFLNVLLLILSFGTAKSFMESATTTIGYTVYTPKRWLQKSTISRIEILCHESIHMKQRKKLGWFLFFFLYLFFPLPILFAYYRAKFEKEAYEESMRQIMMFYGVEALDSAEYKNNIVSQFTSPNYLWMWLHRSSIEKWYDQTVAKLKASYPEE